MQEKIKNSPARVVARRVLARVEHSDAFATLALSAEMHRSRLSDKDKRLTTEICYGVLRHRSRIDAALAFYAHKGLKKLPPPVILALRVAAYQMIFLDRVPDHAAVDDAVHEVRRVGGAKLAGFANGLLRKLSRQGEPSLPDGSDRKSLMTRYSLPDWVFDALMDRVGPEKIVEVAEGMQSIPSLTVRVNRTKTDVASLSDRLTDDEGAKVVQSSLYPWALHLSSLGSPEFSQSFADGLWTVQDLAAQLVGAMACVHNRRDILDACAGVGGKTTHLAETAPSATIDAIDLSPKKIELLKTSLERLGITSIRPMVLNALRKNSDLKDAYDLVVLDAPCSGLGVLRRHPEQKWTKKRSDNKKLVVLQEQLLESLSRKVKVGGHLLYSVCTFTIAEGPGQIARFLETHDEFEVDPPKESDGSPLWSKLLNADGSFCSWPKAGTNDGNMDAFYAIRLRRAS